MLYTSYFANLRKLPSYITPISICGKAPDWYTGLQYKKLAPKWNFFKQYKEDGDENHYINCFNEQVLKDKKQEDVLKELQTLANNENIALICYEKPDNFCHRHLVAKWFNEKNINCREYIGELI